MNYFAFTIGNKTDTTEADIISNNVFALQNYSRKKNLAGNIIDIISRRYLGKDGNLVQLINGNHGRITMQKYDSLGRIRPAYTLPVYDSTISHLKFYPAGASYTLFGSTISITDIPAVTTTISNQRTTCSGSATIIASSSADEIKADAKAGITFYPNPVKQNAVMNFNVKNTGVVTFTITSSDGKLLQQSKVTLS